MALSAAFLNQILRSIVTPFAEVSLHTADPGTSGGNESNAISRIRIDLSYVRITDGRIIMARESNESDADATGTATHYGLWRQGSTFIVGGKLKRPIRVARDTPYRLKAGSVLFVLEQR
jgi:hypothetical protein